MNPDSATLIDIARAATRILEFIGDMKYEAFVEDEKTQFSVIYQLLVMGEAAKRLSPQFRTEHQQVPWTAMAGMRDHLIHAYDTVDWDEVWRTATEDVPELLGLLDGI